MKGLGLHIMALALALWTCSVRVCAQEVTDSVLAVTGSLDRVAADSLMAASDDSLALATDSLMAVSDSLMARGDSLGVPKLSRYVNWRPDPIRAMWLSVVLPGAGQVYNRKYWKVPLLYGGFLGCMYALNWNNQMLRDYSQAYLDIMDDDPMTKSYEKMLPMGYDTQGNEQYLKDLFKRKKDYFRRFRDLSVFAFVGVYILGIIDAYVDAELSTFDISKDLSLRWGPSFIQTRGGGVMDMTPAITCQLTY